MRYCCFSCGSKNSCKFSKKTCHKPILQLAVFATELLQTSPMFFVWKACPGVCKIWRKQEKLFRFDSNLCISSGLFLKLNFNDFYSWQEKFMGWTVACWFSYEPQVYGAGPCHQLPNGGQGAVALATIFWFKYFQGLSTLGYNPFSCRTKRWHANRLAFPSWSSRVFPSACVCSPLSPVYLAECGKKHFTCPLIFHWTKKHNSAYPQIYFPGEIKAGGKKTRGGFCI